MGRAVGRRRQPVPVPFTDDEDAKLRDMIGCGLASDFWKDALPGRSFGEIADRAFTLAIPRAPLL